MDFLASQEGGVFFDSPTSTRNHLTRAEVERQRSKADKVTWFTHNVRILYNIAIIVQYHSPLMGIKLGCHSVMVILYKVPKQYYTLIFFYFSQEFLWRSGASFLWFIFLLPAISVLYVTLVLFSIRHPIAWITGIMFENLNFYFLGFTSDNMT